MAEQDEVVVVVDNKRKHEDLEPNAPQPPPLIAPDLNGNPQEKAEDVEGGDDAEAKRRRLEDTLDDDATENGHQDEEKPDESAIDVQPSVEEAPKHVDEDLSKSEDAGDHQVEAVVEQPSAENVQLEGVREEEHTKQEVIGQAEELEDLTPSNVSQQADVSAAEQQDASDDKKVSRKMEVPNSKVGVLIGKAGDTIRYLQLNSGARIQITRDAEADPKAASRPVELIGTLESINKAEKLIKDVIAEADAGGSPSLVARGFSTVQAAGVGEQIHIQVPTEKVGVIIGKGGETIKSLQTRSGARIQLIPQNLSNGEQPSERTVRITGDKKQIEMAREMIKEVMDQPARPVPTSGGYNQPAFQPRGSPASQWGARGPHPTHQSGYDYPQRGRYQSQNLQNAPKAYGNYPPQHLAPRSNTGWEQRPPTTMQGPPHGSNDYYGRQGGHTHVPGPVPAMGPPPSQSSYNYGPPQGPEYGQPASYSQTAPPAQSYSQRYNENQVAIQHPYGGNGATQQSAYPQGTTQQGYGPQEHYGKPPSYGVPPQGPHAQPYGQPRAAQPSDMPYHPPISSAQSYAQPASAQPYPYGPTGQMQPNYSQYGSAPSAEAYNHPAPVTASAAGYPQQGVQPVSGYVQQTGGQQVPGYAQYPVSQPVYTEQAAPNNAGYGYQGTADPAHNAAHGASFGAPPTGQPAYSQVAPTQQGYDQTIPQPGYPQYDANQIYGAQH